MTQSKKFLNFPKFLGLFRQKKTKVAKQLKAIPSSNLNKETFLGKQKRTLFWSQTSDRPKQPLSVFLFSRKTTRKLYFSCPSWSWKQKNWDLTFWSVSHCPIAFKETFFISFAPVENFYFKTYVEETKIWRKKIIIECVSFERALWEVRVQLTTRPSIEANYFSESKKNLFQLFLCRSQQQPQLQMIVIMQQQEHRR